jgi:hypothetical protein
MPKNSSMLKEFDIEDKIGSFWIICEKNDYSELINMPDLEIHFSEQHPQGGFICRPGRVNDTNRSGWIIINLDDIFDTVHLPGQNLPKFVKKTSDLSTIEYTKIDDSKFYNICYSIIAISCYCIICKTTNQCCHFYNGSLQRNMQIGITAHTSRQIVDVGTGQNAHTSRQIVDVGTGQNAPLQFCKHGAQQFAKLILTAVTMLLISLLTHGQLLICRIQLIFRILLKYKMTIDSDSVSDSDNDSVSELVQDDDTTDEETDDETDEETDDETDEEIDDETDED